jgi:hypothetical protein
LANLKVYVDWGGEMREVIVAESIKEYIMQLARNAQQGQVIHGEQPSKMVDLVAVEVGATIAFGYDFLS